mmetsp:Transcript_46401/g.121787  ORF Transcript_46401/g.121787 Transcript_46401/m.121787 type:complete len:106 (+) Transcript_46401:166-483(+)
MTGLAAECWLILAPSWVMTMFANGETFLRGAATADWMTVLAIQSQDRDRVQEWLLAGWEAAAIASMIGSVAQRRASVGTRLPARCAAVTTMNEEHSVSHGTQHAR